MEAFAGFATAGALPITERLESTLLALPMGGHVSPAVAYRVASEIHRIVVEARDAVSA
jgi:dTDP-4-amino-4,6-dideoxygalactose transaminase